MPPHTPRETRSPTILPARPPVDHTPAARAALARAGIPRSAYLIGPWTRYTSQGSTVTFSAAGVNLWTLDADPYAPDAAAAIDAARDRLIDALHDADWTVTIVGSCLSAEPQPAPRIAS